MARYLHQNGWLFSICVPPSTDGPGNDAFASGQLIPACMAKMKPLFHLYPFIAIGVALSINPPIELAHEAIESIVLYPSATFTK